MIPTIHGSDWDCGGQSRRGECMMVKASIHCERSLFMDVSFWTFSFYKIKWLASYSLPELKDMYMHVSLPLPLSQRWWQPTPLLLPGKSHERRSLVGCGPWGREELDTTERLHFHFSLSCSWRRKWQPTPGLLPWESQRGWSLVGCRLWGHTESETTEATAEAAAAAALSLIILFVYGFGHKCGSGVCIYVCFVFVILETDQD